MKKHMNRRHDLSVHGYRHRLTEWTSGSKKASSMHFSHSDFQSTSPPLLKKVFIEKKMYKQ
jgi:hypothetical protein